MTMLTVKHKLYLLFLLTTISLMGCQVSPNSQKVTTMTQANILSSPQNQTAAIISASNSDYMPVSLTGTQQLLLTTQDNQTYRILLSQPLDSIQPTQPIVITLDGDTLFPIGLRYLYLQQSQQQNANANIPTKQNHPKQTADTTPVLIGIGYPDTKLFSQRRLQDYPAKPSNPLQSLISHQILEQLTTKDGQSLGKNRHISLIGHSLGGLFVLQALAECMAKDAHGICHYQHIYIASPSLWWQNGKSFELTHDWFKDILTKNVKLPQVTISVGELEQTPLTTDTPQRQQQVISRQMVDNAHQLHKNLQTYGINNQFVKFEHATHHEAGELALKQAINDAFVLN